MDKRDCIYPDCQQVTDFGSACEHSCPYESDMKEEARQWHKERAPLASAKGTSS